MRVSLGLIILLNCGGGIQNMVKPARPSRRILASADGSIFPSVLLFVGAWFGCRLARCVLRWGEGVQTGRQNMDFRERQVGNDGAVFMVLIFVRFHGDSSG